MPGNAGGDPKITPRGNENTVLFIDTKTSVLLQTAKIFVSRADDPNHRIQANFRHWKSTLVRVHSTEKCSSAANYQSRDIDNKNIWIRNRPDTITRFQLCVLGMTSETYLYVNAYAVPIMRVHNRFGGMRDWAIFRRDTRDGS